MKATVLLLVLQTLDYIQSQETNECSQLDEITCRACLEQPRCSWCSDEKYSLSRCNTPENHRLNNCPSNHTINPLSEIKSDPVSFGNTNQISPKKVTIKGRIGKPVTFDVEVQSAKDYPVDFYYLMDMTATMCDDLESLRNLATRISTRLGELTKNKRLAFGSFVDKHTAPYTELDKLNKPFCRAKDEKCPRRSCAIPYDFKHVLSFTEDGQEFKRRIQKENTSGNYDVAEGTFDALMQVASCEKELGWRSYNSSRRMVLIATDGIFHLAGDGKLGGIVEPNDRKCHLSPPDPNSGARIYTMDTELDYPTISQVYKTLQEARIQPIFAVSSTGGRAVDLYKALANSWEDLGATFGTLQGDSSNVLEIIEESYNKTVSRVRINAGAPEGIDVTVVPNCRDAVKDGLECKQIALGSKVSFSISITATDCAKVNKTSFQLVAPGFGEVEVDFSAICSCDCENVTVENSTSCSGNGTLVCGRCDCNPGWSGRTCQCDPTRSGESGTNQCRRTNTSDAICEGNGECNCGECQCGSIGTSDRRYYGEFCQCSDFNCPLYNGTLCGGDVRGKCKCGQCNCEKGYISSNCGERDCSLLNQNCLDNSGGNCSGRGTCVCGECICETFYVGDKCETCPSCRGRCDGFKTCAFCAAANGTGCNNCPRHEFRDTKEKFDDLSFPERCSYKDDDGCTFRFTYGSEEGKNETILYILTTRECPEGPDVLTIVLAVIGGIVGIGLILLLLWKLLTAMVDRREYQKFEQDRARSKWHREKNPLYQPATSTVQNPTYVGSKSS